MFDKTEYNIDKQFDYFAIVMKSLEKISKEKKWKKLQQKNNF
jgi:hypothetical protein